MTRAGPALLAMSDLAATARAMLDSLPHTGCGCEDPGAAEFGDNAEL